MSTLKEKEKKQKILQSLFLQSLFNFFCDIYPIQYLINLHSSPTTYLKKKRNSLALCFFKN